MIIYFATVGINNFNFKVTLIVTNWYDMILSYIYTKKLFLYRTFVVPGQFLSFRKNAVYK